MSHSHDVNKAKAANAEENILIAFFLNFAFIIIEVIGGLLTNSIAILSDAIHDFGDCTAIGFAYAMEKLSSKNADDFYTYGYKRFSLLSALVTSLILVVGGAVVVYSSIKRLFSPQEVSGLGMLIIAVIGVVVNGLAVLKTSHGHKLNEKVISLHMLEDVLGWAVVLVGSIFIWLFGLHIVDPILSIGISFFILIQALRNMRRAFQTLLERAPVHFDMAAYKGELLKIQNVSDVHHVHVWELDDENLLATLHVVVPDNLMTDDIKRLKQSIKEESAKYNIGHLTIQVDFASEDDNCKSCV